MTASQKFPVFTFSSSFLFFYFSPCLVGRESPKPTSRMATNWRTEWRHCQAGRTGQTSTLAGRSGRGWEAE
ncbi:hypothetical protein BC567DRAFT_229450 [Phyllosticta citribraziliensis]